MAKFKRFVIALLLPGNVAALILYGRQVWSAVSLHPAYFPTPNPTIASATANLDALEAAEALVPHGGTPAVADRNLKQGVVESDLKVFKAYLLALCLASPALADALIAPPACTRGRGRRSRSPSSRPAWARSRTSHPPGEGRRQEERLLLLAILAGRRQTWVTIGTTTVANTSLLGTTPLTTYLFRFQSTIKQTTSAWSQTITFTTPRSRAALERGLAGA